MDGDPDSHLRLLAERTLAQAVPGGDWRIAAVGLRAAANAYVLLGLLTEAEAEEILTAAADSLTARGLGDPQLSIRAGAHDYWQLRDRGRHGLAWMPRIVVASTLRLVVTSAEMRFEWLRLSRAGVRFGVQAITFDAATRPRHAGVALAEVALVDSAGHEYQLYWDGGSGNRMTWVGEVVAQPAPSDDVSWLELRTRRSSVSDRIRISSSAPIPVGTTAPPWPTPGESYLALLAAQAPRQAGSGEVGPVLAVVAEALLLAGAIPPASPILPLVLGRQKRSSHPDLPATWPSPVRRTTPPDMQIALGASLPLAHAVVVIEGLSAWQETLQLHVYGWPWVHGAGWPVAIPSFTLRAYDDLGGQHEGMLGSRRDYGNGEGHGDFTLWPAVPRRARQLRVVVSTLWESAWADVALPRDS